LVGDEEHGGFCAGRGRIKAHDAGLRADVDGTPDAAIDVVERHDAARGAIGDVHFGGVGIDDGVVRLGTEEHGVADFVGPGVDGLQTVSFRGNDVKFAAVGLQQHGGGLAGEFKIGEEDGAFEIDDAEAILRAGHDEGDVTFGSDDDFVGLRNYGDGVELPESGGVVNAEGVGATIDDEEEFLIWREAGLHGFGAGLLAGDDGAGVGIDGEDLIGGGGGGEGAAAVGGEIERIGKRANVDAGDELIGGRVNDEDETLRGIDAPDFIAMGGFAKIGDAGCDVDFLCGAKGGEVDDGDVAVVGGDVGVEVDAGTQERGAVFAEEDDGGEDQEGDEDDPGAGIFVDGHWGDFGSLGEWWGKSPGGAD